MTSKAYRAVLKLRGVNEPRVDVDNPSKLLEAPQDLPPTGTVGGFLQLLANGRRWVTEIDGGNASGVVVGLPNYSYPPRLVSSINTDAPSGDATFIFTAGTYVPEATFTFS